MTSIVEQPRDSPDTGKESRVEVKLPQETLNAFRGDELRARVFYEKYALRDADGRQTEKIPEEMWRRVARELASPEKDEEKRMEWASKFYWLLEDWRFVPGGRILFGAGQTRKSTNLNCYFFSIREDSIEAIFDWCKEAARTYSFGGGVGCIERDAFVLTRKGVKRIQDVETGEKVMSFDPLLEDFQWRSVLGTHRFDVARQDSVRIGTDNGSYIITSYWHPTLVYDNGAFVYKKAEEVREGDVLVAPDASRMWFEPRYDDTRLGWLLGAYLGDGSAYSCGKKTYRNDYHHLGKEREAFRLKFANDDLEVCRGFADGLNQAFGGSVSPHQLDRTPYAPLYEVSTNGYYVTNLLEKTDWQVGRKAALLKIPSVIWYSSKETMLAFLAGLIDTDGHVVMDKQAIAYSTTSRRIVEEIQAMLSLFGVTAYYRARRRGMSSSGIQGRHDVYELSINDIALIKGIAQYMRSRAKKLKLMAFSKRYNRKKSIRLTDDFVKFFLQLGSSQRIWSPTIRSRIRHGKRFLDSSLFFDGMKDLVATLHGSERVLCRYYLELLPRLHRVKEAVRGGSRTTEFYDLTVEGTNNYLAGFGGFYVVHNTDISVLRPKGAPVNNSAIYSSGSVSFMELLSTTTGTIGQAGRRGALMITIRVDHPDVTDFINLKRDLKRVNYANISVKITDDFMRAVETDADFLLHFKNEKVEVNRTVRAREVWKSLVKGAWLSAEPGVLFWDTIKRDSTTEYNGMEVQGVNPCSEQTLESYGCCCLGSVNLSAFVKDPFTERASIDWDSLTRAAQYGVRFLDNVLDYNAEKHPLPQQKVASLHSRRIGVGITGLGDMLIKLGLKYDDDSTIEFVDHLFERIKNVFYDYSTELAREKGSFPAFDAEKHLAQPFISRLDGKVKEKIRAQGIRNAAVTTIPPVGSGSILAGTSSGVEPVFALFYTRRSKSLSEGEFRVFHPLVKEYMTASGARDEGQIPNYFVTSHQIRPEMRVKMQATIQKHIDTAISSCLTEDTMILTSEGPRILRDLVNRNDSAPGFHAHNLTVINEDGEEKKSDSYFVNGAHPVKRVRTFGNRAIRGTPNHRVRVLDPNYDIVWKRLDELTANDWVVGRVGLNVWGSNEMSIGSIVGKKFECERRTNSKEITWPVRPTKELGRFLGYVVADGGLNRNGVSISMRDDDSCFNDCVGLPKEIFGLEARVRPDSRSPHLQEIRVNSRELVAWLSYVGLEGDCYTKEIPTVIFGAGRETVKEFLRGVTHDGHVSNSSINVVDVTNERLATEIMYLLENFGITSTLQVEHKTGQHMVWQGQATNYVLQSVFHVAICGHEARKYVDMIGFAQEEKQNKAETIFGNRDDRIVPYGVIPDYGLRKQFRERTLPRIKNLGLYRHFHSLSSSQNRRTIDRDTVTAMSDLGLQVPKYLTDPTYVFQKVEEISEERIAPTFDLSVPQGNNYIANGLVCHNTVNLPEDITPEEVEKIYLLAWRMGCFLKGNDIYTGEGLKDISEITAGDMVLSHDGRYHRVTEAYHLPAEVRRFVRLDLQGMEDLVATAEHPILVLRPTAKHWQKKAWADLDPQLMWLKIKDVQPGDHVLQPKFRFESERINEITISNHVDSLVRDGKAYPHRTLPWKPSKRAIAARSNGVFNVVRIDEDFVWFLGWFIAEGHFDGRSYVRMTLNPSESEIADRLEKVVFQKFGLRARREFVRSGGVSVRLQWGSRIFSQFLEQQAGRGARKKHLPTWFTRISPELLETMIKAWSSGDGDGTANGGVTTSKRLWREIFMAQSQLAHLTMRVSQSRSGLYRVTEGTSHCVGKQWNKYFCYMVRRKSEFLSSEPVYNFAVEGADSYVVNGVTVHNCKGITVYREGSREGILETEKVAKKELPKATTSFERPKMMEGKTLKLKLPQGSIYLTANLVEGEIKEVFVTLGKSGADENADAAALGRLISLYLQHGGDIKSIISTLKGIKGKYVSWDEGTQLLSIPDAIAKALELLTINHVVKESGFPEEESAAGPKSNRQGATCPDCNEPTLIFESGCYKCTNCGYSKCE